MPYIDDIKFSDIENIRSKICLTFLYAFAILAVPALLASLSRINTIGFQPVMAIHVIIAVTLWTTTLFHKKVSYSFQAGLIVSTFMAIGLGGIYQFGLVAGGIAFLIIAAPIATLLFSGNKGILTLAISMLGAALLGALIVTGNIRFEFDLAEYAVASTSWITSIVGWLLATAALTVSLLVFNKSLTQVLSRSKQHEAALKLSEERLSMVLEGSEQGFWDWNIVTGEVIRNDRWAQMLGYSTIKEFEDNTDTWTNCIHPDDRDAAWQSINDHLEGRKPAHKFEYRMLTKDGGYKWILDCARIVQRDKNGKPMRMSGTHSDITARKKMEEEREELVQSLVAALDELKVLKGIIPICSYCHKIRDEEGGWNRLEAYISKHSDAEFSHGICPECLAKARKEVEKDKTS